MSHISLKSAQNGLLNEMGGQFKDKMSNFGKLNFFRHYHFIPILCNLEGYYSKILPVYKWHRQYNCVFHRRILLLEFVLDLNPN